MCGPRSEARSASIEQCVDVPECLTPRARVRRWHILLAVIPILAAAVASNAGVASSGGDHVVVRFVTKAKVVPQGQPFPFRAMVQNPTPAAVRVDVTFTLTQNGRRTIAFAREVVLVPPSGSVPVTGSVTSAQWFARRGRFRIDAVVQRRVAGAPLAFAVAAPRVSVPVFQDVTARAGLAASVIPDGNCGHWTNGAAWGDVDGNGYPDLYLTRGVLPAQLFLNDGRGRFREVGAAWGVADTGAYGAVIVDVTNDGLPDLYVARDGANRLYSNDGNGHFTDRAAARGVADPSNSVGAAFADYDGDGRLDLLVVNYARCKTSDIAGGLEYAVSHLFHQEHDGTFTDQSSLIGAPREASFAAAWFDANGDGRPDLYIGNDYVGQRPDANYLWRNDGPDTGGRWHFSDVTVPSGTAFPMNTMGIAVGDFNRDGSFDFALSNIEANRLLLNRGDGTFVDVARYVGVGRPNQRVTQKSVTWGTVFGDLNLDGWEDLYFGAGALVNYAAGLSNAPQRNEVFVNNAGGEFLDLSAPSHADDPGRSRGVAIADFDRDGRLDIFVVNQNGRPRLFRNLTPRARNHWLEIKLVGRRSNRSACGARLMVDIPGPPLTRGVFCGSNGISSGSDTTVHVGLGRAPLIRSIRISWPSGVQQVIRNVRTDRLLRIVEPRR